MTSEGIKEKKAQIKTIVKNYEAQLEIPADTEAKEDDKAVDNQPEAMEIDPAGGEIPSQRLCFSDNRHLHDTLLLKS